MMSVVRLCNAALDPYSEPEVVGTREWNAWYIRGEVRALGIKFKGIAKLSTDVAFRKNRLRLIHNYLLLSLKQIMMFFDEVL